jgi:hypothetical protein
MVYNMWEYKLRTCERVGNQRSIKNEAEIW